MMAKMDCALFDDIVDDLVSGRMIDEATRVAAFGHFEACPLCAASFEDRQSLAAALKRLASASCREEAPAQLENILWIRFREQAELTAQRRKKRLRVGWMAAAALAACALILITRAVWLHSPAHTRHNQGFGAQHIARIAGNPQVVADGRAQKPASITSIRDSQIAQSSSVPATMDAADDDWSEDFIPLPDAEGAPPVAAAQVVTVRLPASDLEEVGLFVPDPAGSQYVTAEVVLGDDGIARAIRLAQ